MIEGDRSLTEGLNKLCNYNFHKTLNIISNKKNQQNKRTRKIPLQFVFIAQFFQKKGKK